MMFRRPGLVLLLVVIMGVSSACVLTRAARSAPPAPSAVPSAYASLYASLDAKLGSLETYLKSNWDGRRHPVVLAAELLPANANQGEKLLAGRSMQSVRSYLDGLQAVGVRGVKVAMNYPVLTPDFPRSSEYLKFYQEVAAELKKRNMVMLAGGGVIFANTPFSDLPVSYGGLTWAKYRETYRKQVEAVIRDVRPDYITIANEPATLSMLTGLKATVADFAETVRYVLDGLDRRGVKIGAGAGSWDDLAYIKALASSTSVDYIDVHQYPINRDFFDRAVAAGDIAAASGKKILMGETWLYKVADSELERTAALATQAEIFSRDAYSFWQPLDVRFLRLVAGLASFKSYEFVSPFWSQHFYGYVDHDLVKGNPSYRELTEMVNREASRNITAGRPTETGLAWKELSSL